MKRLRIISWTLSFFCLGCLFLPTVYAEQMVESVDDAPIVSPSGMRDMAVRLLALRLALLTRVLKTLAREGVAPSTYGLSEGDDKERIISVYKQLFGGDATVPRTLRSPATVCFSTSFSVSGTLNSLRSIYTRLQDIDEQIQLRMEGFPPDWTPISVADIPFSITEPGVYKLLNAVDSSPYTPLIIIDSPGVLLDLCGHTIEDPSPAHDQVGVDIRQGHVTVQDGRIRGCAVGVQVDVASGSVEEVLLRDLNITSCTDGILCKGLSNARIANVMCVGNATGITLTTDSSGTERDVEAVEVENCLAQSNTGAGFLIDLSVSTATGGPVVLISNTAINNGADGFSAIQNVDSGELLLKSNTSTSHASGDGYNVVGDGAGAAMVNNYGSENNSNFDVSGVVDQSLGTDAAIWDYWEDLALL